MAGGGWRYIWVGGGGLTLFMGEWGWVGVSGDTFWVGGGEWG